jgi:hypothetical protein
VTEFNVVRGQANLTVEYDVDLIDAPYVTAAESPTSRPKEIVPNSLKARYRNGKCEWVTLFGPRVLKDKSLGRQIAIHIDRGQVSRLAPWLKSILQDLDARADKAAGIVYEETVAAAP